MINFLIENLKVFSLRTERYEEDVFICLARQCYIENSLSAIYLAYRVYDLVLLAYICIPLFPRMNTLFPFPCLESSNSDIQLISNYSKMFTYAGKFT